MPDENAPEVIRSLVVSFAHHNGSDHPSTAHLRMFAQGGETVILNESLEIPIHLRYEAADTAEWVKMVLAEVMLSL